MTPEVSVIREAMMASTLSNKERALIDAYWRATNYLSVGQIYLYDNPLLKQSLTKDHIKPRLLGHWGTTPGLNFIYVHLNRVIKKNDLDVIYITGPGHGGPGLVANAYLEGTYSEVYPNISLDEDGNEAPVHPILFSGRYPEPRCTGDARFNSRGRRTRLRPLARLRSGFRQPRLDRGLRRRRRRSRDWTAGNKLAFQQVPEPGDRRGGFADTPLERLQDCQSLHSRPHQP